MSISVRKTDDGFYSAFCITGPTHNLLRIQFSLDEGPVEVSAIEDDREPNEMLSESVVLEWAGKGLAEINSELGTAYCFKALKYVPWDSNSPGAYFRLAKVITEFYHREQSGER